MSSFPLHTTPQDELSGSVSIPMSDSKKRITNTQEASEDPKFKTGWRFKAAFASMAVIIVMAALDATSLSVALPIIARAIEGSAIEAFWSGTSFLLTSTVFQPVLGSLSHLFGRKPMVYMSLVLFFSGSVTAALAANFDLIITGRSIQGVGGGGIIALTEIIVTDMVPLRHRGKWLSVISAMWAVGTVVGPVLGGGFAQNHTWRWIFWINLPFIGVGGPMIAMFLNLNLEHKSFLQKLRRVDWIGMVLFIGSMTGLLIPITWGGVQYSWNSWKTLAPMIISAFGIAAFILHQEFVAPEPLIRTSIFKNVTAAVTYLDTVIHGIILWSILYYLPLYYEAVKGFSPIMAGIALFPQTFTVAPASAAAGVVIALTGKYRWAIWVGWLLLTVGMGLLILLNLATSLTAWVFISLLGGLGAGMLFPAMAIAVQCAAPSKDQAYAATMFSFLRALGQTIGVAISGTIFQNRLKAKLMTYPLLADRAQDYSKDAANLVQIVKDLPSGDLKDQLRESYAYALQYVWIVMTAFAAVAAIASIFTKQHALDQALETEQSFNEERA